jgi:hypothetical protein
MGVQDAVNLGWKLAQVVKGISPDSLLDSYHAERHPVAARVLRGTTAQVALMRADDRIEALRDIVSELLGMDEPRKRFAARMSGLDIHYDLGEGHPLLGRVTPWADRVQSIDARYDGTWELPAIGAVTAPSAVLVRPDGYAAWVGDRTQVGLAGALTKWFGPAGER